MSHPLILGIFETSADAASAARGLRILGVSQQNVSIVARSHEEEGALAEVADASPGSELEDSRAAARLGELSAHLLAAVALMMPGIGPIVADGPLAAGLGEVAGHFGGGIARTLERAGLERSRAENWESRVERGAILVGAHVDPSRVAAVRQRLVDTGSLEVADLTWPK